MSGVDGAVAVDVEDGGRGEALGEDAVARAVLASLVQATTKSPSASPPRTGQLWASVV